MRKSCRFSRLLSEKLISFAVVLSRNAMKRGIKYEKKAHLLRFKWTKLPLFYSILMGRTIWKYWKERRKKIHQCGNGKLLSKNAISFHKGKKSKFNLTGIKEFFLWSRTFLHGSCKNVRAVTRNVFASLKNIVFPQRRGETRWNVILTRIGKPYRLLF